MRSGCAMSAASTAGGATAAPDGTQCRGNRDCATANQWCGSRVPGDPSWNPRWTGDVCQSSPCVQDLAAEHRCPDQSNAQTCSASCSQEFVNGCFPFRQSYEYCRGEIDGLHPGTEGDPLATAGCTPGCFDTPEMAALNTQGTHDAVVVTGGTCPAGFNTCYSCRNGAPASRDNPYCDRDDDCYCAYQTTSCVLPACVPNGLTG